MELELRDSDGLGLAPVSRENIQHRIYVALRKALMCGAFVPGRAMSIQELAATFGTSTMPVREALRRLVAEQALEIQRNRSVAVPPLTRAKLEDLLRVRLVVEGTAVEWAAANLTEAQVGTLDSLCGDIDEAVAKGLVQDYLSKNQELRFVIYRASGSPTMLPIIESLWLQIGPYLNLLQFGGKLNVSNEDYLSMIDALRRKDGEAARRALEVDMTKTANLMLSRMKGPSHGSRQEGSGHRPAL